MGESINIANEIEQKEYRIAEFNALRAEIIAAIGTMRVLFTVGLATFGTLVSVSLKFDSPLLLHVAAAVEFTITILMAGTYRHVHKIGMYIRIHIEKKVDCMGWEEHLRPDLRKMPLYIWNVIIMGIFAAVPLAICAARFSRCQCFGW